MLWFWPYCVGTVTRLEAFPDMEPHFHLILVLGEYPPQQGDETERDRPRSGEIHLPHQHPLLVQTGDLVCTLTNPSVWEWYELHIVLRKVKHAKHDDDYVFVTSEYVNHPPQSARAQINVRLV